MTDTARIVYHAVKDMTAENLSLIFRDELLTSLTHKTYFNNRFQLATVLLNLISLMTITFM